MATPMATGIGEGRQPRADLHHDHHETRASDLDVFERRRLVLENLPCNAYVMTRAGVVLGPNPEGIGRGSEPHEGIERSADNTLPLKMSVMPSFGKAGPRACSIWLLTSPICNNRFSTSSRATTSCVTPQAGAGSNANTGAWRPSAQQNHRSSRYRGTHCGCFWKVE